MTAAAAIGLAAGFGLRAVLPAASDWIVRAKRSLPWLAGLAIVGLVAVLVQEAVLFEMSGHADYCRSAEAPWAIVLVLAVMAGLAAACIALAVVAEAGSVGTQRPRPADIRLCGRSAARAARTARPPHHALAVPRLLQQYWMFIVMAVAFAGAGLSEWFHRRKLPVLSRAAGADGPCAAAGAGRGLLDHAGRRGTRPGLWSASTPAGLVVHGPVLRRPWPYQRSSLCTVLAVLTLNIGLWVALHQLGIGFLRHPQLWLIPVALAGLVAEHLNRHRLTDAQSTGVPLPRPERDLRLVDRRHVHCRRGQRLAAAAGVDGAVGGGVLLGILLRVRSFLYLGVTFLLLDIVSMIWHAAVDLQQTWIWYVCGIALGAAIIALFAVFEKRRNDVLLAVEKLKEWKG